MENVVIFMASFSMYFAAKLYILIAIWYILWLFGIFFPLFGMLYREQSGNPAFDFSAVTFSVKALRPKSNFLLEKKEETK
jgi:hypothetical protein